MSLVYLLFLMGTAEAASLECDVAENSGRYGGGRLLVEESSALTVRWRGKDGREETLLGERQLCGFGPEALPSPMRCEASFTRPTPLKKLTVLCKAPGPEREQWVGSVLLSLSPAFEDGRLGCRTKFGVYTDFNLTLKNCKEFY